MDRLVVRRALRLVFLGALIVAVDVTVRGWDVVSDAVGLAVALGGLAGLHGLAGGHTYRQLVASAQILVTAALTLTLADAFLAGGLPRGGGLAATVLPIVALNLVALAMRDVCRRHGRRRAGDSWSTTFSAIVTVLDVPAAVVVTAAVAGVDAMVPVGLAGVAVTIGAAAIALLPLLHFLLSAQVTETEEPEARGRVVDLRARPAARVSLDDAPTPLVRTGRR